VARSFGLVDYKVQETEYFLLELKRLGREINFAAVQFCASAFVSAARSITFAMQASLKGHSKFEHWYKKRQEALRNDPLAKFFHDFRTVTQHIGVNVVGGGSHGKDATFYYFVPCPDLPIVPEQDVISACESYFVSILQLVYDCYVELGPVVDGQQYFTQENFAALGKTIEDAEEELGFPRGWTDISRPDIEPYRWQTLRYQADGCLIEEQFERWLNKCLPRPEPLPPFQP
jgi:hypothetical protein